MSADLDVRPGLVIPGDELEESTSRAGGPGGQSVNTTSSRVSLRWNVPTSKISDYFRNRLLAKLRLTRDGDVLIHADEHKSQLQNRDAARDRLVAMITDALVVAKKRVATKPSKNAKKRRVDEKKARGATKRMRGSVDD